MTTERLDTIENPLLISSLSSEDIEDSVGTQLKPANYLLTPDLLEFLPERTFSDSETLWKAVLNEELYGNVTITLRNFLLSEWFPRSPGLFYTPEARESRLEAMSYIQEAPAMSDLRDIDHAARAAANPDYMYVFNAYGKARMLNGGIGSIRLKPKAIDSGEVWFMSASDTLTAHEGFPVALPNHIYNQFVDQIKATGVAPCTLIGKLRFVPNPIDRLYKSSNVPQLYLSVTEAHPGTLSDSLKVQQPKVSVAVSFLSDWEGYRDMYASYVTFFPGRRGSLEHRVDWLENEYVKGMYQGEIISDFDEHRSRFGSAPLSLERVMTHRVGEEEVVSHLRDAQNYYGDVHYYFVGYNQVFTERVSNVTQGKVVSIGGGANINAPIVIADTIQNSFNTIEHSSLEGELKATLQELIKNITEVSEHLPDHASQALANDSEALARELTTTKRNSVAGRILETITDMARSLGDIAKPILDTGIRLAPLLVNLL